MQFYGKMMLHSEPVFSEMAQPMNKQILLHFGQYAVCKRFFCLIAGLANYKKTGSETGKI